MMSQLVVCRYGVIGNITIAIELQQDLCK